MRLVEEVKMSLKGLLARPMETSFLILGIALGIGATATGLSLFLHTVKVGRDLINLPQYREVIVKPGIDSENADAPAILVESTRPVNFSSSDLLAVNEIPAASHAYLVRETEYRLGNVPNAGQVMIQQFGQVPNQGGRTAFMGLGGTEAGREPGLGFDNWPAGAMSPPEGFGLGPDDLAGGEAPPEMTAAQRAEMEEMRIAMVEEFQAMTTGNTEIGDPEPSLTEIPGKMVSAAFFEAMQLEAAAGSVFTESEANSRSRVVVLGADLAKRLYEDGQSLGRQIIMNRQIYSIIGVLEPTGTDTDNYAYTPYSISVFGGRVNSLSINFMITDPLELDDAESQIQQYFTQKQGVVSISTPRRQAEEANNRNSRLAIIILFLAGSGFFIAVVNVSNILLSRTIRQFRNIGIYKALGASRLDIFRLYFMESGFLAGLGMLIGIVLAGLLSMLLKSQLANGTMSPVGMVIGIIVSTLITLLITLYPSYQASKVPAAQAVKME